MKPKVYIETSIPSYLTARPSNDIRVVANQNATIDWWENRRPKFDLYISEFVIAESSQGDPNAAARRIAVLEEISVLQITDDVRELAKRLMDEGALPQRAELDAYHIAVAAVNGIDYLLTWNCTHIANAIMRPKIELVCRSHGFEPPINMHTSRTNGGMILCGMIL